MNLNIEKHALGDAHISDGSGHILAIANHSIAEHIVKCVNLHEELIDAIKSMKSALDERYVIINADNPIRKTLLKIGVIGPQPEDQP